MDIFNILNDKSCTTNLVTRNKDDCLKKLSHLLSTNVENVSEQDIYNSLMEREKLGSTGFEDGIAIPHAKIKGLSEFAMSIAISKKGVDFNSIDGKKTHILFAIIGPEEETEGHLQILAQISRISRNHNARKEMLNASNALALREAFIRYVSGAEIKKEEKGQNKLLMIVLYEKRFLEDIIELFLEKGIRGVNILESTGIKDQLSNIPLFSGFLDFLGERKEVSKTIMAIVDESDVSSVVEGVEEIMGDFDTHTGAMIMVLDIFFTKGSMEV